MNKNYYLFSNGILSADQSVFRFDGKDGKMVRIPVEGVSAFDLYGGVSITSGALNLATQHNICAHIFGYYGNYLGSFWPKEAYFSGDLTIKQALVYSDYKRRFSLGMKLLKGIQRNMYALLKKYNGNVSDLELNVTDNTIEALMLAEARMRKLYYSQLDEILDDDFKIGARKKRPPTNYGNCLISFGNSLLYSEFVTQSRKTSVNITIPFYHSPESGRFALALDLSEVFKPGLVDRMIVGMTKQGIIRASNDHFHDIGNGILLNETGKKIFVENWENWMNMASYNVIFKRKVSHRELIKMEIHKYAKEIEEIEDYNPIKLPKD
ncbi:CRISPR-associated endonuclease Cas1 [Oxyplasma meridianum]|uniref:CRISPR-associated endonuclease Cas1 n=1 Tax=Oxyplasma meridianum TaxID=3073602 RepID=A0AAX4NE37_9ARCH